MRPMRAIARSAPAQALIEGRSPLQIQIMGRTRTGVVEDSVVTMPTSPLCSAAIRNDMPRPVPMKADATQIASAARPLRAGRDRAMGGAAMAVKNAAAIPERTAMAVKGSTLKQRQPSLQLADEHGAERDADIALVQRGHQERHAKGPYDEGG